MNCAEMVLAANAITRAKDADGRHKQARLNPHRRSGAPRVETAGAAWLERVTLTGPARV